MATTNAPRGRLTSFDSILHKAVHDRLDVLAMEMAVALGNGAAKKSDPAATAAEYHEAIGYIRALRECQRICEEVSTELIRAG